MADSSLTTAEKIDFGACRAVKLTCVSEIGWSSNDGLMQDIASGGGIAASQWHIPWREENARGSCSLLEVEGLDGSRRRLLIDSGWNRDYMRDRFAATGVDRLLRTGEIEGVFLTHEHMDHLFGLQAVLELKPDVSIYIPSTFTDDACRFIAGIEFPDAHASNAAPHQGALIRLESGRVHVLMPGLAAVGFDLPIMLGIEGEQSLYVKGRRQGLGSRHGMWPPFGRAHHGFCPRPSGRWNGFLWPLRRPSSRPFRTVGACNGGHRSRHGQVSTQAYCVQSLHRTSGRQTDD